MEVDCAAAFADRWWKIGGGDDERSIWVESTAAIYTHHRPRLRPEQEWRRQRFEYF